jgi:hypothetical protein
MQWASRTTFVWRPLECATSYNVYRETAELLPDVDGDGLVDRYGTCYLSALPKPEAIVNNDPPLGFAHYYWGSGSNSFGEGSIGMTSAGLVRPITSPCP